MFGLAAVDIDRDDPEWLARIADMLGQPLAAYSTPSGGYHALYPIRTIEDAKAIPANGYRIDGEIVGEVACLHRFANCWEPISWLKAAKARSALTEDADAAWLAPDALDFVPDTPRAPKRERDPNAPPPSLGVTAEDVAEYYGLDWDANRREWHGHCPKCDAGKTGGGTRFRVAESTDGGIWANCWECAPNGWSGADFFEIIDKAISVKTPRRAPYRQQGNRRIMKTILERIKGERCIPFAAGGLIGEASRDFPDGFELQAAAKDYAEQRGLFVFFATDAQALNKVLGEPRLRTSL